MSTTVALTDKHIKDVLCPTLDQTGSNSLVYKREVIIKDGIPVLNIGIVRAKPLSESTQGKNSNAVLSAFGMINETVDSILQRAAVQLPSEFDKNPEVKAVIGQPFSANGTNFELVEVMNVEGKGSRIITEKAGVKYQRTALINGVETPLFHELLIVPVGTVEPVSFQFFGKQELRDEKNAAMAKALAAAAMASNEA